jgi:zinc transport system ATP-binding protein
MNDFLLSAEKIRFVKDSKVILQDVSLQIRQQEIITLIGPNGAGKTSLIRILLGLLKADSGVIHRHKKLRIGYVPQTISIPQVMPLRVRDFLTLSAKALFNNNKLSDEQVHVVLESLEIKYLFNAAMQGLSGGELQRVLLARALLKKPQLLILDEPAAGMDVIGQQKLYETIKKIRDSHACGILMVSHDLHLVMAATDRVICLNTHVCCTGHPDDVSEHPEYLKLFGSALSGLALYSHHHDHEHDMSGNVIESEHCLTCEHGHHENEGHQSVELKKDVLRKDGNHG